MELLLASIIALGTTLATKAVEKTGEKLGEAVFDKSNKFLSSLQEQSPETVTAIELAPAQPLDYSKAVQEIQSAASNPEIKQLLEELVIAAQAHYHNPTVSQSIKEVAEDLKTQQPTVANYSKLADEIKNVFQGNTIIGGNF